MLKTHAKHRRVSGRFGNLSEDEAVASRNMALRYLNKTDKIEGPAEARSEEKRFHHKSFEPGVRTEIPFIEGRSDVSLKVLLNLSLARTTG